MTQQQKEILKLINDNNKSDKKKTKKENPLALAIEHGLVNIINPAFLLNEFVGAETLKGFLNRKKIKKISDKLHLENLVDNLGIVNDKKTCKLNRSIFAIMTSSLWIAQFMQVKFQIFTKRINLSGWTLKQNLIIGCISMTFYFIFKALCDDRNKMLGITPKSKKELVEIEGVQTKAINFKSVYSFTDYINKNYDFGNMDIPCLYGVDDTGNVVIKDMVSFPHLILMGKTGNGKSSFLNCMLQSSMYFKNNVLYIMTDFKDLELCQYEKFNNTIYIKDLESFAKLFENIAKFVKARTKKFKSINTRNIETYNSMVANEHKEPYIVFVIDECAELKIHKDKKLVADINDSLKEAVNKFRALGIIFILCLQRASGEQLDTDTRSQLPEKICFNVDKRDSEFVDITRDEVKHLKIGELRNKDKNGIRKTIKSFFIQDNPMKNGFANEVYESLYLKNVGEEFKYFKMLPENQNNNKKFSSKNFDSRSTSTKVLEIKKILTENLEISNVDFKQNLESNFKVDLSKNSLENLDAQNEGSPKNISKTGVNDENLLALNINNYSEDIQKFISFLRENTSNDGYLPNEVECLKKMEITPKKLRVLKEKAYKLDLLKKEDKSNKMSKYIVNFSKICNTKMEKEI